MDRDRVHDAQRLDKMPTTDLDHFKGIWRSYRDGVKEAKTTKAERPLPEDRNRRQLPVHVVHGRVVEHRDGAFGLSNEGGSVLVRAWKKERPPVGASGAFAIAGQKRLALVAIQDDEQQWVPTRGSWQPLLGTPALPFLFELSLFVAVHFLLFGDRVLRSSWYHSDNKLLIIAAFPLAWIILRGLKRVWRVRRIERDLLKQLAMMSKRKPA